MSRLADLEAELLEIEQGGELTKPTKPHSVSFVSSPTGPFSEMLAGVMERLLMKPTPRVARAWFREWPDVVDDAQWLVSDGWAERALLLGWDPLHLFGIAPDENSDARPGLAVWLNGSRRLVLLDERSAISREGDLRRCFNCRSTDGAVFLWDLK